MKTDYIIIKEFVKHCNIEPDFIDLLEENDLIRIYEFDDERCFHSDELADIERYSHLYYDLSINIEGIDAIRHLLKRINAMQEEMRRIREQLIIDN